MKKVKKNLLFLLCILSSCFSLASLTYAASNKALRVKTTLPVVKEDGDSQAANVMFGALPKKKCKATKNMKLSCTLYIPTSALDKNTFISIDPMAALTVGEKYYGTVFGKYRVHLELEKGKPVLYKETDNGLGKKLSTKIGTVKKKKGFYVVTLKKIPLCSWAFDMAPENKLKINTKKNFNIHTYIRILRHSMSKKWKGYLYVDDLTLHAGKTLKMTFDKKDYKELLAYKWVEEKVKASVAVVK